jgi:class 3 adenylate cyclase
MLSYVESRTSRTDEQDAEEQRAAPSLWQRARQRARQWAKGDVKPAGSWSEVQSAQEYTFWLLFCELDHADSYRRTMSEAQAQALFERFRSAVLREMQRVSGREWMWKEVGGVLLFPFDGHDHGPALVGLRMVLNRVIINVEDFAIRSPISFRLALHVGNTVYRNKGETGTIVSDAVNYVFHLGERFTRPGCFTITETAAAYMPHTLESYFLREGEYEGREIFRMREPVAPV